MKKLLSLMLAAALALSLAACGGTADTGDAADTGDTGAAADTGDAGAAEGGYTGPDWEAIDAMDYDSASNEVYDWNLGEFLSYYEDAKEEVNDLDMRMALMAIANAKLMESGTFLPFQTNGGNYAMTRVVPRTVTTTSWGLDEYRYYNILVANELLTPADRTALTALWSEAATAADAIAADKAYLEENGYTLNDVYNFSTSYIPKTWDVIATSQTSDSYFIAGTYDNLLEYDIKNVQQPALAESYEVSDDALTYTFHIRQGVKWVDQQGREIGDVTADDWVASMEHLIDNNDALGYLITVSGGCGIKNYEAYVNGEVTDFAEVGVKAIDDYTLEYTLEAPFPPFLSMLGYGCFAPLNRAFYKSQGGTFSTEGETYTAGNYGKDPSSIAYCGPYLITNYTANTVTTYKANPTYWNADAINTHEVNISYNDGTDTMRSYNESKDGTIAGAGFNSSSLEQAKQDTVEGGDETYFDKYAYVSQGDATTFGGWFNLYRQAFTNYNDETKGVSPQTEDDRARTRAAMNNQHFRLAMAFGIDRGAYIGANVGEDLKYASMRNSYVPSDFSTLTAETTVSINGTEQTFPAGTYFGEIVQAQLDADEIPITVWDPTANDGVGSGDGFDGWYSADNAKAQLDLAIAELAQVGVDISADAPIYIDVPYATYNQTRTNMVNALKQSLEASLEGKVIVNLIGFDDADSLDDAYYRVNDGSESNFDLEPYAGWGPDYGDAQTYLDTIQPYGYMCKNIGLF